MNEQSIADKEFSKLSKLEKELQHLSAQKKYSEALHLIHEYCYSHYDFDDNMLIRNPETDIIFHLYDQKKLTITQIEVIMSSIKHKAEIFADSGQEQNAELFKKAAEKINSFIQTKVINRNT